MLTQLGRIGRIGVTSRYRLIDTLPDTFDWGGPVEGEPDELFFSNEITISGATPGEPLAFSTSGGHGGCCGMQIQTAGAGEWSTQATSGTAYNGDKARLRTRAHEAFGTEFELVGTIGGVSDTFTVATAEEALPAPAAPVIAQLSDDGANPLTISVDWGDDNLVPPDEFDVAVDQVVHRHRVDAGVWVTDDPIPVDTAFIGDHLVDGEPIVWPLYTAATFTSGETVGRMVGIIRDGAAAVWSNEVSDEMAATDVVFTYGNKAASGSSSTAISFSTCAFAGGGRGLIFLTGYSNSGGTTDSLPASITIKPTGGGSAINCSAIGEGGRQVGRAFAIYQSDSDVTAGNYDITGTRPSAARSNVVMWGTLIGANPTPAAGPTFTSGSSGNPQVTSSLTCPANGLLIGAFMVENDAALAANTDTTLYDQVYPGETGLALGFRSTTGTISANATPAGTYNWGKGIVAFEPASEIA